MENLVLLPTMAQKRRGNFGQFAEDATIISEETTKVKRVNHFIEANTMEIDLQHLQSDCIVPVFSKDNELTISHNAFIETVWEAANTFFTGPLLKQFGKLQTLSLQVKRLTNLTFVFRTS